MTAERHPLTPYRQTEPLNPTDIERICCEDKYTTAYTSGGKSWVLALAVKDLLLLPAMSGFLLYKRGQAVNKAHIAAASFDGQWLYLRTTSGAELRVSRNRDAEVRKEIKFRIKIGRSCRTPWAYQQGAEARSAGSPCKPPALSGKGRSWWLAGWNDRDVELASS